jgi:site-specific DNA-methyltransferase (adenine-specific)
MEVLKDLPSESIDSVVTDPPYGLSQISTKQFNECMIKWCTDDRSYMPKSKGFMGKSWDSFVPPPSLWDEVYRVLKPGGHALIFAGSRTQDLMGLSLRLAGFEMRDVIQWIYGEGFPKSLNIGKAIDKIQGNERKVIGKDKNFGATKKEKGKTTYGDYEGSWNITKGESQWEGWGTALKPAYEPALLVRKPVQGSIAQNVLDHGVGGINIDGCRIETNEILGRLKGGFGNAMVGANNYSNFNSIGITKEGGRFPSNVILNEETENTEWKRFFYCAKASREEREEGLNGNQDRINIHPTVKPIDLMRYLCRLITPPNGTILEPFMGSGSTGIAAVKEGFNFIGIEREEEYFEIAKARIEYWSNIDLTYDSNEEKIKDEQLNLFG